MLKPSRIFAGGASSGQRKIFLEVVFTENLARQLLSERSTAADDDLRRYQPTQPAVAGRRMG
jgi:hypothetical protein